jgi:hypothetical protein
MQERGLRVDIVQQIMGIVIISVILLLSFVSLLHALRGKSKNVPLLRRLSLQKWIPTATLSLSMLFIMFFSLIACLSYHSIMITPQNNPNARVFMLYDDLDFYPRWIFTLGFLPITRKAIETSGPDSVCVCKLTPESIRQAFSNGKFVFLATHGGGPGKIHAGGYLYTANYAQNASAENQPTFIYLTACNLGKDNESWPQAFPNAEVVSFERWSAVLEHAVWLYSDGPRKVEESLP